MIEMKIDQVSVDAVKSALGELSGQYKTVMVTSINKTLTTAKVQATARIGNELNLTASRIKEDMTINKANFSSIKGSLVAVGEPVGLVQFGANQTAKGVTVKVLRSSGRSLLKHAYIAKGRGKSQAKDGSTKMHVWWRGDRAGMPKAKKFPVGKKSTANWMAIGNNYRGIGLFTTTAIERRTGPRIEDIFGNPKVLDPVSIQASTLYLSNVNDKITSILERYFDRG
jgi:hypothetical protein